IPDVNILLQITGVDLVNKTLNGTFTLFPLGTVSGSANITLSANDTALTTLSTFNVFVQDAGNPLFAAPNALTVNANGPGSPYPSTNTVAGLIGTVEKVVVNLNQLTVQNPANTRFLLVGPTGANVLLMAGAGGNNPLPSSAPATIVFDDTGP